VIPDSIQHWFDDCPFALIAFSGGVDSSLVAALARKTLGRDRCLAVISASPSLKLKDLDEAKQFALEQDIPLRIIVTRELENPDYADNPANRCYFCKFTLYSELKELATEKSPCWILNGTNLDDQGDYRPGLQAAAEFEVRSPLLECGLDKQAVRDLASAMELRCWNKPAAPCLSSRIPYGERVTADKLRRIESAESWLASKGFEICRVRHPGAAARVEVAPEHVDALGELLPDMESAFRTLGFDHCEIDTEGFVSGKLNRKVSEVQTRPPH